MSLTHRDAPPERPASPRSDSRIRARDQRGNLAWDALFEPIDLLSWEPPILALEVEASDDGATQAALGWVEGNLVRLIVDLERDPTLAARPFACAACETRWAVGLSAPESASIFREAAARRFEAEFAEWAGRPAATRLSGTLVAGR